MFLNALICLLVDGSFEYASGKLLLKSGYIKSIFYIVFLRKQVSFGYLLIPGTTGKLSFPSSPTLCTAKK
jgi:hypothetical protein